MKRQVICITVLMALLTGSLVAATSTGKTSEATTKTNVLSIVKSTYEPVNWRDPFGSQVVVTNVTTIATNAAVVPTFTGVFQLQGILSAGADSSAIVNDKLLTLNKLTTVNSNGTEVQVKAVEIGRDRVVLEVAGQKVELLLKSGTEPEDKPKQ